MSPADFAKVAEPYIRQSVKNPAIDVSAVAALLQARCEKLTEIPEKVDFFDALPDYDVAFFTNKKSKTDAEVSARMLQAAIPALEGIADWTQDAVHDTLIALAESLGVKNATLMWPVRIAAAGKLVTPGGAVELCHILGVCSIFDPDGAVFCHCSGTAANTGAFGESGGYRYGQRGCCGGRRQHLPHHLVFQ